MENQPNKVILKKIIQILFIIFWVSLILIFLYLPKIKLKNILRELSEPDVNRLLQKIKNKQFRLFAQGDNGRIYEIEGEDKLFKITDESSEYEVAEIIAKESFNKKNVGWLNIELKNILINSVLCYYIEEIKNILGEENYYTKSTTTKKYASF